MNDRVAYFAYGSNLCVERILARTPQATVAARGWVDGFQLVFHKRSRDGSGKADAFFTGSSEDRVWGAVYWLAASEKPIMDRYEGLGVDYEQRVVEVQTEVGSSLSAWVYTAHPATLDASARPYGWYKNFVVTGAAQHGLPADYCERLATVTELVDPNQRRDRKERARIGGELSIAARRVLGSV